jgi:hypothetical protein
VSIVARVRPHSRSAPRTRGTPSRRRGA